MYIQTTLGKHKIKQKKTKKKKHVV